MNMDTDMGRDTDTDTDTDMDMDLDMDKGMDTDMVTDTWNEHRHWYQCAHYKILEIETKLICTSHRFS
jgi:hypothetical protein